MTRRLLELFSGTGSVSKAVGHLYDEIVSIDILEKFKPTEISDILTWNYKKYPVDYFHTIWASPPCTEYSKAKSQGIRNLALADSIVQRTIEIIEYFNPEKWYIENPQTGLLKDREFMWDLPYVDVDYCQYGYSYRKRTRLWTNINYKGLLCNPATCTQMVDGKHKSSCGNGYKKYTDKTVLKEEKYSIPDKLIKDLFTAPF
jgi:site-specific DNA-cytosine methylase